MDRSIRGVLLLVVLPLLLALTTIGFGGLHGAKTVGAEIDHAAHEVLPALALLTAMEQAATSMRIDQATLTLDPHSTVVVSGEAGSSAEDLVEIAYALRPHLATTMQTSLLDQVMQDWDKAAIVHGEVERLALGGHAEGVSAVYIGASRQYFQDLADSIEALRDSVKIEADRRFDATAASVVSAREAATSAVLVMVTLASGALCAFAFATTRPRCGLRP